MREAEPLSPDEMAHTVLIDTESEVASRGLGTCLAPGGRYFPESPDRVQEPTVNLVLAIFRRGLS
jgi:hypothetical protein